MTLTLRTVVASLMFTVGLCAALVYILGNVSSAPAVECVHKPLELSVDTAVRDGRSAVYSVTVLNSDTDGCGARHVRPSILPGTAVTGYTWPEDVYLPPGALKTVHVKLVWQSKIAPSGEVKLGLFDVTRAPTNTPVVIAHRGASGVLPENTERAVRIGRSAGDGIEVDVRSSKGEDQVLMHDLTLDRSTNGAGLLSAIESGALSGVRVDINGGNDSVPTLVGALSAASTGRTLIDIKYGASLTRILSTIQSSGVSKASVASSNWYNLDWFKKRAPGIDRILVWLGGSSSQLNDDLARSGTKVIAVPKSIGTPSFIGQQKGLGRQVYVFSGTSRGASLRALVAIDGIAGVITDYPAVAKYYRDEQTSPEVGSIMLSHGEEGFGAADRARLSQWFSSRSATQLGWTWKFWAHVKGDGDHSDSDTQIRTVWVR